MQNFTPFCRVECPSWSYGRASLLWLAQISEPQQPQPKQYSLLPMNDSRAVHDKMWSLVHNFYFAFQIHIQWRQHKRDCKADLNHLVAKCCSVKVWLDYTYHDACQKTNPFPTVGVGDHVAVANGQESDRDQPHRPEEGAGDLLCVVIPAEALERKIKNRKMLSDFYRM